MTNMVSLLREWGIEVGTNVVVDVSGVGQLLGTGPEVPVVANYPSHPIVDRFNLITAFPLSRSVTRRRRRRQRPVRRRAFLETSARSWAEADIDRLMKSGEVEPEETKGDRRGPDLDWRRRVGGGDRCAHGGRRRRTAGSRNRASP